MPSLGLASNRDPLSSGTERKKERVGQMEMVLDDGGIK